MKITDNRKSVKIASIATRTQADTDAIYVEMVARLTDVQATADLITAAYDVSA